MNLDECTRDRPTRSSVINEHAIDNRGLILFKNFEPELLYAKDRKRLALRSDDEQVGARLCCLHLEIARESERLRRRRNYDSAEARVWHHRRGLGELPDCLGRDFE